MAASYNLNNGYIPVQIKGIMEYGTISMRLIMARRLNSSTSSDNGYRRLNSSTSSDNGYRRLDSSTSSDNGYRRLDSSISSDKG